MSVLTALPQSAQRSSSATEERPFTQGRPVVLVRGPHLISARLATDGYRVSDILNDPERDFLTLQDARLLQRVNGPAGADVEKAVIVKNSIDLLLILDREREAVDRGKCVVQKIAVPVVCTAANYQISGNIGLSESGAVRPDPIWMLMKQTSQFFALTQARLVSRSSADGPFDVPVVIVNKRSISLFGIEAGETAEEQEPCVERAVTPPAYRSVLEELGF